MRLRCAGRTVEGQAGRQCFRSPRPPLAPSPPALPAPSASRFLSASHAELGCSRWATPRGSREGLLGSPFFSRRAVGGSAKPAARREEERRLPGHPVRPTASKTAGLSRAPFQGRPATSPCGRLLAELGLRLPGHAWRGRAGPSPARQPPALHPQTQLGTPKLPGGSASAIAASLGHAQSPLPLSGCSCGPRRTHGKKGGEALVRWAGESGVPGTPQHPPKTTDAPIHTARGLPGEEREAHTKEGRKRGGGFEWDARQKGGGRKIQLRLVQDPTQTAAVSGWLRV